MRTRTLRRKDDRVIIHFDYDCFYASVIEAENPSLKSLPLAVQQKQIIVTCNYEARRRGLRKLQLITEAKRICPDVVIVLGEDLTRFRDASKELYSFLREYSWNQRVERLGFDEVWMDVTDIVDFNMKLLNVNDLSNTFFQLSKTDLTLGFDCDASKVAGNCFPASFQMLASSPGVDIFLLRLILGSHLALWLRHQLEEHKGYTSTVGISTSKLLSKLVGNVHKPRAQTTLLPPYGSAEMTVNSMSEESNVSSFLGSHDIGSIPWIGFKLAQKLREFVLGRSAPFETGLIYGAPKERITVAQVRQIPDLSAERLEAVLGGPGAPHGIGLKVYLLLHGVDDEEVAIARNIPRQISIEDSYMKLDTMHSIHKELHSLSCRLIERMRIDLTELDAESTESETKSWMTYPTTARLSTRPRPPLQEDGTRARSFQRISRSAALPAFVFSLSSDIDELAQRLVAETWLPLFKKLHPEKDGWNLSLINVAVTGMDERHLLGADIGSMFRKQRLDKEQSRIAEEVYSELLQKQDEELWQEEDSQDDINDGFTCGLCGNKVPFFAQGAHQRYHDITAGFPS